jgi:hypothetical protein
MHFRYTDTLSQPKHHIAISAQQTAYALKARTHRRTTLVTMIYAQPPHPTTPVVGLSLRPAVQTAVTVEERVEPVVVLQSKTHANEQCLTMRVWRMIGLILPPPTVTTSRLSSMHTAATSRKLFPALVLPTSARALPTIIVNATL